MFFIPLVNNTLGHLDYIEGFVKSHSANRHINHDDTGNAFF